MPSADRQTVLIVGLGLIGGSIARALTDHPSFRVLASGRDDRPLRQAQSEGVIENWSHDIKELAPQADIVVVATPTRTVAQIFSALADCVTRDTIITDAASVKGSVVADARRYFPDSLDRVVPAHPIAGSEQTGYAASRADLYTGRNVIVTPDRHTSTTALRQVVALWQHQGADVHLMSAERHDEILAGTSHLPHLLAFDLVNTLTDSVSEPDRPWQVFDFAAGGFADFSRIAASDATMWRDIFLTNSKATAALLDCYIARLQRTRDSMLMQDGDALHGAFSRAKAARDDFIASFNARRQRASHGNQTDSTLAQPSCAPRADSPLDRELVWQPVASIVGECRISASYSDVLKAIAGAASEEHVTVLHGCLDNRQLRDFIQCQIGSGVLIAGPDCGCITIYRGKGGKVVDRKLPADPVLVALLALMLGNESTGAGRQGIRIKSGLPEGEVVPPLLTVLQTQGVIALQQDGDDLCLLPAAADSGHLKATAVVPGTDELHDDELLLAVIAMLWRSQDASLQVTMPLTRARQLLHRLQPLQVAGVLASPKMVESDMASDENVLLILRRVVHPPSPLSFAAGSDEWLALSVMSVSASSQTAGRIREVGDIRAIYPGFIQLLDSLGMDIREQPQQSKE